MLIAVLIVGTGALTALAVDLVPSSVSGAVLTGSPQDNHVIVLSASVVTESGEFATDATIDLRRGR